jgi:hypothetical protein
MRGRKTKTQSLEIQTITARPKHVVVLLRKVEQVGNPHMDSPVRLPVKRLICVERLILLVDYG